jgi:hypothetical protein
MNTDTGRIRELKLDERPKPREVELTAEEADRLLRVKLADRVAELERMRGHKITGKRARRLAIRARREHRRSP